MEFDKSKSIRGILARDGGSGFRAYRQLTAGDVGFFRLRHSREHCVVRVQFGQYKRLEAILLFPRHQRGMEVLDVQLGARVGYLDNHKLVE